jgi:hypothetical protein
MSNGTPTPTPPIASLTPCEKAKLIYDKAFERWLAAGERAKQNQGVQEYEVGTRKVVYVDPDKARRELEFDIGLARMLCPSGDFPGPTGSFAIAEDARYGIITDV